MIGGLSIIFSVDGVLMPQEKHFSAGKVERDELLAGPSTINSPYIGLIILLQWGLELIYEEPNRTE